MKNLDNAVMVEVFSPYITVNGKRIFASAYGLKAFRFLVTQEEHAAYLKSRKASNDESYKQGDNKESQPDSD